jgi:hypothetical protein
MSERGNQSVRDGLLDSSNGMMILYQNILANMTTSMPNVRIQRLSVNGSVWFGIP